MTGSPTARAELRALARPAFKNRAQNPYNARIYERLSTQGVKISEYGPLSALLQRPHIFHVHWPESTFNHGLIGASITTSWLLLAMDRLRRQGTKVVWTLHNLRAHERRYVAAEERFWAAYLERVDAVIAMTEAGLRTAQKTRPQLADKASFVIPHPHYRGEYPDTISRSDARKELGLSPSARVLLFFGHIKAYKRVTELIRTARELPQNVVLVVAGKPRDSGLRAEVERAAQADPRVRLHLLHVPSERAQYYFRAADLVVLPYREILNSGTALLALSFDRPVYLPSCDMTEELRADVGARWVHQGDLERSGLLGALEEARELPERTDGAHLGSFDPDLVAQKTADCYRRLSSS